MYRVKGADQKEYGPISADQVLQWIRENRLNRASLAERDGEPGWKPLEQFPEFAAAFSAGLASVNYSGGVAAVANPEQAARSLKAPAIILIFFAVAGIVFSFSGLFLKPVITDMMIRMFEQFNLPQEARAKMEEARDAGLTPVDIFQVVLGIATNIVMLIGALKMMKVQSWGLSLAAAILVMLPCSSCCCLLGIPLGIWVIVLLNKPEVKAAFR